MGENIGFIGLGIMGAPMAANLMRAGHALGVYNRSPGKAAPLLAAGATAAPSPAALAGASDTIVLMLTGPAAIDAVLGARARHALQLAGFSGVDAVKQRREGVAQVEAAPAAREDFEHPPHLGFELGFVVEVRVVPVDLVTDRCPQAAFRCDHVEILPLRAPARAPGGQSNA